MGLELLGEERRLCASAPDGIARDALWLYTSALRRPHEDGGSTLEVLGLDVSPLLSIHMGLLFAGGTGRAARRSTGSGGALRGRSVLKVVWLERWGRGPRELGALRGRSSRGVL